MSEKNLYQPFEWETVKLKRFSARKRRNNFFEIIYVIEGRGTQTVNGNAFIYKPGNLFLMTPQDSYSFAASGPTEAVFIRFNDSFVRAERSRAVDNDWLYRMDYILQNAGHLPGCIVKNQTDKSVVTALIESVLREDQNRQLFHERIIRQTVDTLLTVVARNISLRLPERFNASVDQTTRNILFYIHQNIYDAERLKIDRIGNEFGISPNYLARYFKKHTGESLQEYVMNYKMKLVEIRLAHSDLRIGEIAYELNFSDESHLSKTFKRSHGINPSQFRRLAREGSYA